MTKVLYVILDGVGDRPIAALGHRTPLEAASTPHLDRLTAAGRLGLVQTVGPGIAPESDVAVMAILGYDPHRYHMGRGPLEAIGSGMRFRDGDLAMRGNFTTLGEGNRIIDRRVGRNLASEEARALAEGLNADLRLRASPVDVAVRASVGHRCAVVFSAREGRLSAQITNTDPAYARIGGLGVAKAVAGNEVEECRPLDDSPEARMSADVVNEFTRQAREILEEHPVNVRRRAATSMPGNAILVRDAGDHIPAAPSMAERFGLRFGCVVEMPVERGIAQYLGMEIVEIPPGQGYRAWAALALETIDRYDALYLHLKGPDEPGHDGDAPAKRATIERIDAEFLGPLLEASGNRSLLWIVTADHATPCELRAHSDDPVPLLVSESETRAGSPESAGSRAVRFTERDAAKGALGTMRGIEILPLIVGLAKGARG